PFNISTGEPKKKPQAVSPPPSYTQVFGQTICKMAEKDERVVGITAAMAPGTGLATLAKEKPGQFIDVGIAEQHAIMLAAGMACEGMRPIAAIYSTFLQRAYDQVYHDVCIQKLPVIFAIDRGGLIGDDGATHQGLYDIGFLRTLPDIVISAASNEKELVRLLWTALQYEEGPFAIRYPRANGEGVDWSIEDEPLPIGKGEILKQGADVAILGYGYMVHRALEMAEILGNQGVDCTVANMRYVKPLDADLIMELAKTHQYFITYEDHSISGGFSSAVSEALHDMELTNSLLRLALPDEIIEHGKREEIFRDYELLPDQAAKRVLKFIHAKSEAVIA
ncbi:1-deoxy-D-xylulose-5-phosphate synthase, partial [bacterium]|nr:1-deoxy-D-xylulose-5-phosphate synthase [bacterium]